MKVEEMICWLRSVSLMDQLSTIDADAIRQAIADTNYWVLHRLKASRTVQWNRTKNITKHGETETLTSNASIFSMAPELSLSVIGSEIGVVEVPREVPLPDIRDVTYLLTLIGQMVAQREPPPKRTLEGLGDPTNTVPNIYKKGRAALAFCQQELQKRYECEAIEYM